MPELYELAILFATGAIAGVMNVMAGGGSSITLPVLIFLGLDAATANGTNRVALIFQNISATASFRRRSVSNTCQSVIFAALTIPGAIAGALAAISISNLWFERILAVTIVGVVISMLVPQASHEETTSEGRHSFWIYPSLFGIGFYGGFIQVGVGFLLMAALYHLLRMNLVFVNMHKVTIVLIYMVPTLIVFWLSGHVDWLLGLSLAAGNAAGAWWAARWMVNRGERIVRFVLGVALAVMAGRLIGLY